MPSPDAARLSVLVHPGSRKNQVLGMRDGLLEVRVAARPVKGEANRELISFIADQLGIARGQVTIEKGQTSRRKVLAIEGLSLGEVQARLGHR